jgi:hypothetical protein
VVDVRLALGHPTLVHEPTHLLMGPFGEFDVEVFVHLLHTGHRVTHHLLHREIDELG